VRIARKLLLVVLLIAGAVALALSLIGGEAGQAAQSAQRPRGAAQPATAIFAGGCFWCTESDFDHIAGVVGTTSGYSGGHVPNPTYERVSAGSTGHYEVVRVSYDARRVSYATLVQRFFRTIDPLDGGGQFCDRGDQYRSAIFYSNDAEKRIAEAERDRVQRLLRRPVATRILPARNFYAAEAYHQDYYSKNPVRYRYYRWNCGRDARLSQVWR
jgi:peptide-methionine (S)-S-oxide reductase